MSMPYANENPSGFDLATGPLALPVLSLVVSRRDFERDLFKRLDKLRSAEDLPYE
jgi:hypothetical protein